MTMRPDENQHPNPKLKKQFFLLKLTLIISAVLLVGIAVTLTVAIIIHEKDAPPLLVATPALTFGALGAILFPVLHKTVVRPLRRAEQVMARVEPKPMLVRSLGLTEITGVLATLHEADVPLAKLKEAKPVALISVMVKRGGLPDFNHGIAVQLYADRESPDRFLVLETEKHVVWGKMSTRASREKSWRDIKRIMYGITGLLILLMTVFFILQQQIAERVGHEMELATASASWPTVQGMVTQSFVKNVRISRGKSNVPGFEAVIAYNYSAGHRPQKGNNIYFCYKPSTRRDVAEKLVANFPQGEPLSVAYQPEDPSVSVLYPGYAKACARELRKLNTASLLLGCTILLTALVPPGVVYLQGRRRKKVLQMIDRWGLP